MEKIFKNTLYFVFGIAYFVFYNSSKYKILEQNFVDYLKNGDMILSYLTAIIGFFTMIGIIALINRTVEHFFKKYFRDNEIVISLIDIVIRLIALTKYVIAFYVFSTLASMPDFIKEIADKVYFISILVIILYYLTKVIDKFFEEQLVEKSKLKAISKNLLPFVKKIIIIFIWVVGAITIIGNLGYDITALVAGAGIGGLAIAFAAQKSISNVFGAITILINKPFKIGDYICIGTIQGTVKDIGLSYLTVTDKMGHQVMLPNEMIISNSIDNFSVRKYRRADFGIGLVYDTSLKQMEKGVQIIETILNKYVEEKTISSFRVNFEQFGDFSLNINVTYFSLLNKDYKLFIKQKEEINLEIKKQFQTAKLEMAFPTQELVIRK